MVPAGSATEATVQELGGLLSPGDCVIDGGNSYYKDDVRRAEMLAAKGIHYLDVGTSGGVWGLERGYCLMIGGPREVAERLDPIFASLAPGRGDDRGRRRGRESKRRHRRERLPPLRPVRRRALREDDPQRHRVRPDAGVRRGLRHLPQRELRGAAGRTCATTSTLDDIAEVWRRGSVVSSWLLDLTAIALAEDPKLDGYTGFVQDSGEGRWTVMAAIEESVPADVLTASLYTRFRSRQDHTFAEKVLSAMRAGFGGHTEKPAP